jgi:hypothetical protein
MYALLQPSPATGQMYETAGGDSVESGFAAFLDGVRAQLDQGGGTPDQRHVSAFLRALCERALYKVAPVRESNPEPEITLHMHFPVLGTDLRRDRAHGGGAGRSRGQRRAYRRQRRG